MFETLKPNPNPQKRGTGALPLYPTLTLNRKPEALKPLTLHPPQKLKH